MRAARRVEVVTTEKVTTAPANGEGEQAGYGSQAADAPTDDALRAWADRVLVGFRRGRGATPLAVVRAAWDTRCELVAATDEEPQRLARPEHRPLEPSPAHALPLGPDRVEAVELLRIAEAVLHAYVLAETSRSGAREWLDRVELGWVPALGLERAADAMLRLAADRLDVAIGVERHGNGARNPLPHALALAVARFDGGHDFADGPCKRGTCRSRAFDVTRQSESRRCGEAKRRRATSSTSESRGGAASETRDRVWFVAELVTGISANTLRAIRRQRR